MTEQIEQAARTAGRTFNISLAELAGANAGQRNDLLALNQAVYRVPDGTLYTSTGSQLVLAQGLPVMAGTNPLTGGIGFSCGPLSGVIGQQNTQVVAPADTAENVLFSMTVTGNTMGANDSLRISYLGALTNSANTKTIKASFGGQNIATQSLTTVASFKMQTQFTNRNSQASQIMAGAGGGLSVGPNGSSSLAVTTLGVNTAADQVLSITGTKASAGESITLEMVQVEIVRGLQ